MNPYTLLSTTNKIFFLADGYDKCQEKKIFLILKQVSNVVILRFIFFFFKSE